MVGPKVELVQKIYQKLIPDDTVIDYNEAFTESQVMNVDDYYYNWKRYGISRRDIAKDISAYHKWAAKYRDSLKVAAREDAEDRENDLRRGYKPYGKNEFHKDLSAYLRKGREPLNRNRIVDNPVTGVYKPSQMTKARVEWLMDYKRKKIREGRINKLTLLSELGELAKLRKKLIQKK